MRSARSAARATAITAATSSRDEQRHDQDRVAGPVASCTTPKALTRAGQSSVRLKARSMVASNPRSSAATRVASDDDHAEGATRRSTRERPPGDGEEDQHDRDRLRRQAEQRRGRARRQRARDERSGHAASRTPRPWRSALPAAGRALLLEPAVHCRPSRIARTAPRPTRTRRASAWNRSDSAYRSSTTSPIRPRLGERRAPRRGPREGGRPRRTAARGTRRRRTVRPRAAARRRGRRRGTACAAGRRPRP